MAKTVNDLYLELLRRFRAEETPSPGLEARELTAFVCGADKSQTISWAHRFLDDNTVAKGHALATRYLEGEPLAYLIGEWDFYGLTFKVNTDVLIPRADTEVLCAQAIERAHQIMEPRVLDLCCGSGCIGLALLHEVEDATVIGVDFSAPALRVAGENAARLALGDRYRAARCDVRIAPPELLGAFHIIVCNPPYIDAEEMKELDISVRYEPTMALYGGPDGLDYYRAVTSKWTAVLSEGGQLLFECGWKQAEAVAEICRNAGLRDVKKVRDLVGIERVVSAVKPITP